MSTGAGERGMIVTHPNREKAVVRSTRAGVIALLLVSAALVLLISIAGSGAEEGLTLPVQYAFVIVYLLIVYLAFRWSRGSLPVASALAVLLAIFAAVGGPSWFEREHSYFGSATLNPSLLGVLTLAIIPVQVLLIVFAVRGFSQGWNVELERPAPAGKYGATA
ncbi:MAG: hypothetical protein ACYCUM_13695 [Solirubrobacteraceae bacterium]